MLCERATPQQMIDAMSRKITSNISIQILCHRNFHRMWCDHLQQRYTSC